MNEHIKKRLAVTFDTSASQGDRMGNPVLAQLDRDEITTASNVDVLEVVYKGLYREVGFRVNYLTSKGIEMPTIRHLVFLWRITKHDGKLGASVAEIASKGLYSLQQKNRVLMRQRMIKMTEMGYLSVGSRVNRQGRSVLIYSLTGRGIELVQEYLAWMGECATI